MRTHRSDGSVDELIELQLRRADLRYTAGRKAIVDLLARAEHPLSMTEINQHLARLPRSSAYRHLLVLEGAGIVRRIAASDGFSRFELAEELTEHHHHLLCTICGRVFDVTPSAGYEAMTQQMVAELAGALAFSPVAHSVDVFGHCATCR